MSTRFVAGLFALALGGCSNLYGDGDYDLDIDRIRSLAAAPSEDLPFEIRTEIIGRIWLPEAALVFGGAPRGVSMSRSMFQVRTDTGHYTIEAGYDDVVANGGAASHDFFPDVWERTQDVLSSSEAIMVTHEHPDHIAGIARHRDPSTLAESLVLTGEQLDGLAQWADGEVLPESLADYEPLSLEEPTTVAPGIVMIPAPGHTAGSVIIYVRLRSGAEYLFIGDIAYTYDNVAQGRDRPKWVRSFMVSQEDVDAVRSQLEVVHDLTEDEPSIHVVPAHAEARIQELLDSGALVEGFE